MMQEGGIDQDLQEKVRIARELAELEAVFHPKSKPQQAVEVEPEVFITDANGAPIPAHKLLSTGPWQHGQQKQAAEAAAAAVTAADADGMPTANNLKARGHSPSTVTLAQTSILSHDDMIKRMWDAKTMGDKLADKALEAEREKQELAGKAVSTILNSSSAATSESMSVPPVTITIDVNGTRVGVPADDLNALGLVLYQPQGQAEGQPAATSFPSQKDMVDAFYRDIETKAANERAARRAEIKAELEKQNQAGTATPAVVSTDSSEPSAPAPTNKEPQMVITLNGKERLVPVGDVLAAFAKLQAKSTAP